MRYWLSTILMALVSVFTLSSQELEWSVDMNAVFNNRESETALAPSSTNIFTRITPMIGVSMDRTRHRIMGGVTWYQPMNDHMHGYKVLPALYYRYEDRKKGYDFKFGMIPNELKVNTLNVGTRGNVSVPSFLFNDSISYVRPNINGFLIKVDKKHFWLHSWLDWRQLQTNNRREAFQVVGILGWKSSIRSDNIFDISAILSYNHLAKSKQHNDDQGVVDNAIFSPQIGFVHFFNKSYDSFIRLQAGALMSFDRDRSADNKWQVPIGFIGAVAGGWKWLRLTENIYAGQRQMPFYDKYASLLYQGDQFYHNKFYSRTDLVATIFQRDFVNLEARLTFHATDKSTSFWQQLAVRFYLDQNLWRNHKKGRKGTKGLPLQSQF